MQNYGGNPVVAVTAAAAALDGQQEKRERERERERPVDRQWRALPLFVNQHYPRPDSGRLPNTEMISSNI